MDQTEMKISDLLREKAENGQVLLVTSGMDCDCVRYSGCTRLVPADLQGFLQALDKVYYSAEGPMQWYIASPSEQSEIHYESRDLALEAFEDGHPYAISQ